jgi:hypothetical protein
MKPIERGEVLGLADYEAVRDRFRARVIEEKKRRRTKLGPDASAIFENRDTVLMQIQEMLRTERITKESSILHEIETYNDLLPLEHELSATILVEIDDRERRERFLVDAKGLENAFALVIAGSRCPGRPSESREGLDRTTAVHYVKFGLTPDAEAALRRVLDRKDKAEVVPVSLVATHPKYEATTTLSAAAVASLAEDLA